MNLPNKITVGRIVAVFIFLLFANVEKIVISLNKLLLLIDFAKIDLSDNAIYYIHFMGYIIGFIAGLSDILDGYLARKYNLVTDFGKLMDPLADKIFIVTMFITALEIKSIPMPAWIVIIIICREFLVTGLRLLAVSKGEVIAADGWGKLKTFLQMMILIICGLLWLDFITFADCHIVIKWAWHISLWGTAFVTILTGYGYFHRNRNLYTDA